MSDDGNDVQFSHLFEPAIDLLRDAEIAELDQQVAALSDAIPGGINQCALHVFEREMKVATQAEARRIAYTLLQFLQHLRKICAIIKMTMVGVWGGRDVLNSIVGCHAAHGFSHLPVFGTIIYFRQDMTVNVDHVIAI